MNRNERVDDLAIASAEAAGGERSGLERSGRLRLARKVGYSAGQLVELTVGSMLNVFALYYLTSVCGLPGWLAGIALGAGLAVDAIMDPFIGSLSDRWRSRWGRRAPFMIAGLVPLVLTFNLFFALPSGLGETGLFVWLMALSIALRVSLSIFALPYQAVGVELSDSYSERSSIAAWRWGLGILGTVAVIVLGYGVFLSGPDGLSRRDSYPMLTLALTALFLPGAFTAIRAALSAARARRDTIAPATDVHRGLFREMAEMFRNRTFSVLFVSSILLNVAQGVYLTLSLHLGVFFWGLDTAEMQMLSIAGVLGLALAAPLAGPLSARIEKRTLLIGSKLGLAICQALPVTLSLLGLLHLSGEALTVFLAAMTFATGVMFALSVIGFIAIIPDAVDEHELLFETRREGLFFAGWAFAGKSATGAGLLIAGVILELIKFPSDAAGAQGATPALPEWTVTWLGIAGGPGSAMLALAGTALVLLYRIDRKAHARIMADLAARRAGDMPSSQES